MEGVEKKTQETIIKKDVPTVKLELKEVKEILLFSIAFGKGVEQSLKDDKFTWDDVPNFMPAFMQLIPALTNLEGAKLELLAASKEDIAELQAFVKEELDLENDQLEGLIEASLVVVFDIWHLVNTYFIKKN